MTGKANKLLYSILFIWCIAAPVSLARADDSAAVPLVHGEIIHDYARVTFEWPDTVYFNAKASGKTLSITFDRSAHPDFGTLLSQLYPYVTHAVLKSDGKTVVLTLNKPYRIRTFVSDNINGIDLLDIGKPPVHAASAEPASHASANAQMASAASLGRLAPAAGEPTPSVPDATIPPPAATPPVIPAPPAAVAPAPVTPPVASATIPAQIPAAPPNAAPAVAPSTPTTPTAAPTATAVGVAAATPATSAAAPAPPPPATAIAPATPSVPVLTTVPAPATPVAPATAATPVTTSPAVTPKTAPAQPPVAATAKTPPPPSAAAAGKPAPEASDSAALPPSEIKTAPVYVSGHLKVDLSAAEDNAVLRFPMNERVALATFIRGHTLWVVISKPMVVDLSDFDPMPRTVVGKAELVPSQTATIIRLPVDDNVFASAVREENSFNWAVLLTTKKRDIVKPLKVEINTDPPAPANVVVSALEMADSVTAEDPLIGDQFVVTPLYNPGEAVEVARDFVEFSLPATAQGIVVDEKADDVEVVQLRNGLRISAPHGASLTPGLPTPAVLKQANTLVGTSTLFPYDEWKPDDPYAVPQRMKLLFHKIVESNNPQDANDARLRTAQIFLSEGLAAEALGHLDNINRTNPAFYRSAKLSAMHGAAEFLMYRFASAAHDFNASELNNSKEMEFWRNVLSDLLGNSDQSYDYLAMNDDYISKYPPIFRERLAIVAADRAIASKEYNTALKIFDILHKDNLLEPINTYVNFLLAKISADTGQEKEALDMWDKLATDYAHPFVRANAEYARIVWGLDHNTLTKEDAIDRLERLRQAWHGDNLELEVLTLLGELYDDKKDYVNAMRIWHDGVASFANTTTAIDMSRKMQEAFIVMFNEGGADNMTPLEALALYYEYQNYTPAGTTGNEMIEHLADRLVTVDLLDQAAALLDHQMRFQTEKEQRSRLGTKLSTIYLLNHQPQKALLALQDSMYGENALPLRLYRNRLTAQAMVDAGQMEKAMLALGQDDSPDAEQIRLGIYWKEKDWPHIISSVEQVLKARKDITAPITLNESEYLLRLALAYVFENNTVQLQYLRDYFGPLMVNNPNKPVFDFITSNDVTLTTTNFDEVIKNLSDTRSFIDNYRARIKVSGLDAAMPPKTKP